MPIITLVPYGLSTKKFNTFVTSRALGVNCIIEKNECVRAI